MTTYSFGGQMDVASRARIPLIKMILQTELGAEDIEQNQTDGNDGGTDFWAVMPDGHKVSIDIKVRTQDYAVLPDDRRADDLALEIVSVKEKKKIGWTLDGSKRTDYILWLWPESNRHLLLPFPMLRMACIRNLEAWMQQYPDQIHEQETTYHGTTYHSCSIYVPRQIVLAAIAARTDGRPQERHARAADRRKREKDRSRVMEQMKRMQQV